MSDLTLPNTDKYEVEGKQLVAQATSFVIESIDDYNMASHIRSDAKARQKAIRELLDPSINAMNKAHKAGAAQRGRIITPLEQVEDILGAKMIEFKTIEDGKRADEQARLDEEAKNKAIAQAESEGSEGLAQAIKDDLIPVTAEPMGEFKAENESFTETYKYTVEDIKLVPDKWKMLDHKKIKEHVTARKQHAKIAGIKVFAEKGIKSKPKGMTTRKW
jgi:hypothetical protein